MLFNLVTKTTNQVDSYHSESCEIYFTFGKSEFSTLIESKKYSLTRSQEKIVDSEKDFEIVISRSSNPEKTIIKNFDYDKVNVDSFRNYLSGIISRIKSEKISYFYVNIPNHKKISGLFGNEEYYIQTFGEGILLGNYSFDKFKSDKKKVEKLNTVFISESKSLKKSISKSLSVIEGVTFARDLVNEPANELTPAKYANTVKRTFKTSDVKIKVYDSKELEKMKMNAIMAVGKGSQNKPKLIFAHYKPQKKAAKKIALVGKGVTYDSGGLSIKPTSGMIDMKADMAGSATVFGVLKVVDRLKLPIEIIGIVPAVENMINGNSYKPGDVIKSYSGKTIEVKDTDAEGRIVLADALTFAGKQKPDEIIDFATLTGACVVALGEIAAGIFTKNEDMSSKLMKASRETYELAWPLPFWDEYNKMIESKIADVANLGPRWGGAITAGKFLEHFINQNIPWTHIDLAGPSLKHDLTNYTKDYCTGYGVRLILRYLELTE